MARKIYFVGIGGSGMSSLAAYLLERGDQVVGADQKPNNVVELLRYRGATVYAQHDASQVDADVDTLVYTAAVNEAHPEVAAAVQSGIPVVKYSGFLGAELAGRNGVAVAGTHGKTSTSAILAHLLRAGGLEPSAVLGGFPLDWPLPGLAGSGDHFVVEACEYDRSFLNLPARVGVVTNVEPDHLDYFGDEKEVYAAFTEFLAQIDSNGMGVVHESAARVLDLARVRCRVHLVGESPGVSDLLTIHGAAGGLAVGTLLIGGTANVALAPSSPGLHTLHNAALAVSTAVRLGVNPRHAERAVRSFRGVERRLEQLTELNGALWFADYAHHPTEIRAVHQAARQRWPDRRIHVVFQPHQACRTGSFRSGFAASLAAFDEVYFPGIFSVRESRDLVQHESQALLGALQAAGRTPVVLDGLDKVMPEVMQRVGPGDVVILMGAGDIGDLAESLRTRVKEATVV